MNCGTAFYINLVFLAFGHRVKQGKNKEALHTKAGVMQVYSAGLRVRANNALNFTCGWSGVDENKLLNGCRGTWAKAVADVV